MNVTCVMKTYGNHDFTRAATWAIRRYHPKLRMIYADGHPTDPFDYTQVPNSRLVHVPNGACEECNNTAVALVDTDYVLFMDNDTKVISPEALPLLLETMEKYDSAAASGWYGLVVSDWKKRKAFVGTEYMGHMEITATQAAFSVHRVKAYREVDGMPVEPFWDVPARFWKGIYPTPGFGGDLTLCKRYADAGWKIISPRKSVPVIHWGQAVEWKDDSKGKSPFDKWWFSHVKHIRCNPLNNWRKSA